MKRNRVNVLTVVNSASNITTETIDGKPHIVVRGITPVVDDIVMNRKLYPAAEIGKAYNTLERNPMPLGHPKVDGKHVSARDVRAVNNYHVGAWLQNVSHTEGKVTGDMYVDRRYAESSDKGKRLINRLDEMAAGTNAEPRHISTGLLYSGIAANGESKGKKYNEIATNMMFDHVAVLLDEPGAGTPDEGVGIFVNSDGEDQQIEVASLSDASNCTKEGLVNKTKFFFTNASNFSFDDIQRALSDKLREGRTDDKWLWPESVWPDTFIYRDDAKYFKQKYLIGDDGKAVFVGEPVEVVRKPTEYEIKTNGENDPMKDLIINALKAAGKPTEGKSDAELMDAYNQMAAEKAAAKQETPEEKAAREKKEADDKKAKETAINSEDMPAWAKLLADDLAAVKSGLAVNADKEKSDKRAAVKAKFQLDDLAVNALDGAALDGLYAQCQTTTGLNGMFRQANSDKSFSEMPE
ncbi:phage protein [Pantoea sp. PSNIH1]|nr:phage protein [Pantoea sp. PSNIH1]